MGKNRTEKTDSVDGWGLAADLSSVDPFEGCVTFKEAMMTAKSLEGGRWKCAYPCGNFTRNAYFICDDHIDCTREMRVVKSKEGLFNVSFRGTHGTEKNLKKRKNSVLTLEQEAALEEAIDLGAKPSSVLSTWTSRAAKDAKSSGVDPLKKKMEEGGFGGS